MVPKALWEVMHLQTRTPGHHSKMSTVFGLLLVTMSTCLRMLTWPIDCVQFSISLCSHIFLKLSIYDGQTNCQQGTSKENANQKALVPFEAHLWFQLFLHYITSEPVLTCNIGALFYIILEVCDKEKQGCDTRHSE